MVKRLMVVLGALVVLSLVLSACATPTPATIKETVVVEKTVEVEKMVEVVKEITPTPEPEEPAGPKTLVICMGQEPDTLYINGGSMLAARAVQEAIYDGPIDTRTFAYQPVILKKLPDREGQSAWMRAFRNHVRKHLTLTKAVYVVGLVHVPVRDITSKLDGSAFIQSAPYEDWHREVAKTSYVPQHQQQDIGSRWPILLATERAAPPILDGWHRFSRYFQLGYRKIPALFFVHQ